MSIDELFWECRQFQVHDEIRKIENLIGAMQESDTGITFKSQKVFLTTIPAAVSGDNLIGWIEHFLGVEDIQEAAHIANVLLLYGYIYPLTDYKSSIVKDDPTAFYRFQAPYYWISKIPKPDAMDYAIYLVKRTLRKRQKYGLEEYEQSALHRLQNMLGHKWEFICIQAANQVRLYKERRKSDKIVLEAQERAFWRVHQPPPSKSSRFEERPARNLYTNQRSSHWRAGQNAAAQKPRIVSSPPDSFLSATNGASTAAASHLKVNLHKSIENLLMFTSARSSYDWFLTGAGGGASDTATPWLMQPNDTEPAPVWSSPIAGLPTADALLTVRPLGTAFTTCTIMPATSLSGLRKSQQSTSSISGVLDSSASGATATANSLHNIFLPHAVPTVNQVRLWATSFHNLLWDPCGCQAFECFLKKEFSAENLHFWLAVNAYQFGPIFRLKSSCLAIFEEFLGKNAVSEINIDSKTMAATEKAIQNPTWFTFDDAKEHIYKLMKSDSYVRFLRSEDYTAVLKLAINTHSRRTPGKSSLSTSLSPVEDLGVGIARSPSCGFNK